MYTESFAWYFYAVSISILIMDYKIFRKWINLQSVQIILKLNIIITQLWRRQPQDNFDSACCRGRGKVSVQTLQYPCFGIKFWGKCMSSPCLGFWFKLIILARSVRHEKPLAVHWTSCKNRRLSVTISICL